MLRRLFPNGQPVVVHHAAAAAGAVDEAIAAADLYGERLDAETVAVYATLGAKIRARAAAERSR